MNGIYQESKVSFENTSSESKECPQVNSPQKLMRAYKILIPRVQRPLEFLAYFDPSLCRVVKYSLSTTVGTLTPVAIRQSIDPELPCVNIVV